MSRFTVGQRVRCVSDVDSGQALERGGLYTVSKTLLYQDYIRVSGMSRWWFGNRFEPAAQLPEDAFEVPQAPEPNPTLHRPKPDQGAVEFPKLTEAVQANAKDADPVNLPPHYARFKIEPIRFLVENFGPVILVGKVVKYSMRYDAKNGLEDIRKAKRCLRMLERFIEKDADWWKAET